MAHTVKSLGTAVEALVALQADTIERMSQLRRDYATLAQLVQDMSHPRHDDAAEALATAKAKGVTRVVTVEPKAAGVRCPHMRPKADGTMRQCRQTLDANGACQYHGIAGQPKAAAAAKPVVAAPAEPKAPKAPTPGGPYTYHADVTCKGVTKSGEPCKGRFTNGKGFCANHHTQVKGRSKTAK